MSRVEGVASLVGYIRKIPDNLLIVEDSRLVPRAGLEPAHLAAHAPETCASTNSATWAIGLRYTFCV